MKLKDIDTRAPKGFDKEETKKKTKELVKKLGELQELLYAEHKHSLLIVLQGMDASGKDGAVETVFNGVNPAGCRVAAFKKPTELELDHDILWRVHLHTPPRGMIQIFNRSHYEDVLITRVHKWVTDEMATKRFKWFNNFEEMLTERNTVVLKFYLHISQEEQHERFQERLDDTEKNWKYNAADVEESKLWDKYIKCYEDVIKNCNTIPWNIIPSDQKWYKEYLIAKTIVDTLESLKMKFPEYKPVVTPTDKNIKK